MDSRKMDEEYLSHQNSNETEEYLFRNNIVYQEVVVESINSIVEEETIDVMVEQDTEIVDETVDEIQQYQHDDKPNGDTNNTYVAIVPNNDDDLIQNLPKSTNNLTEDNSMNVEIGSATIVEDRKTTEMDIDRECTDTGNIEQLSQICTEKPMDNLINDSSSKLETEFENKSITANYSMDITSEAHDVSSMTTTFSDADRTSTPMSRELKILQRTVNDSKVLTEYLNDIESKARKMKELENEHLDENVDGVKYHVRSRSGSVSSSHSLTSRTSKKSTRKLKKQSNMSLSQPEISDRISNARKRSLSSGPSGTDGGGGGGGSIGGTPRRNMRSLNAEFSAKHQKFLQGVQNQQESDFSENSDGESEVKIPDKKPEPMKKLHPPPKVSFFFIYLFKFKFLFFFSLDGIYFVGIVIKMSVSIRVRNVFDHIMVTV